ncbi:NifU family protein [Porphyromonas circumdentaria]|uniref:Fe-S cluster biogenesis protein NfuA, 4Fe-4S-binding domain n=1 Tax=Porphyromonas circumdentaria TaxID=29524 RepID=A0A1T4MQS7_9PORP|nr:NifU family protein [Porphyromonas circumdentaria]MBB6275918.1 Fe-S cluster biogenesis protein NfuA [Porphyromonas circumdentaria]MDO4723011.1 NifU family protein [Porphyromonas circumdentaria]SJZ69409.1 Fe-S cluster biogenesis protein NfuA, 4Fe-4S-binding domain [Porphyromonas circumdentaria]
MSLSFDAVQAVLEQQVNPLLASHGGGVKLCSISPEGDIRVTFKGACATCPSMRETLDELVEGTLQGAFPEEKFRVIAVLDMDEELLNEARALLRARREAREAQQEAQQ